MSSSQRRVVLQTTYAAAAPNGIFLECASWYVAGSSCSPSSCASKTEVQVLDEADRLLTSTFADDLAHLFKALPRERQTALFTATWTPAVDGVADAPPRPGKQKPFIHRITSM